MAIPPHENPNHAPKPHRRLMENRRASATSALAHDGTDITVTAGYYPDGSIGEVFINSSRPNSAIDAIVSDAAIAVSFALQHGADLAAIKSAMKRNAAGEPSSPIGAALDRVAP